MLLGFAALPVQLRLQPMIRLVTVAFAGEPEFVERLLSGPLASMNENGRDYWLGVAHQARGELDQATQHFDALRSRGMLSAQAEWRVKTPLARVDAEALPAGAKTVLAELKRDIGEVRPVHAAPRPLLATPAIAAVLIGLYLVRFLPGWGDMMGLIRLGALVLPPELTHDGVLWRLVGAGLLHANAAHLLMNIAGLWIIGRDLEQSWGSMAVAGLVLGSSVGAYTIALFFMSASREDPRVLLGASAGLMGLVGAIGSYSAVGHFLHKKPGHQRRLSMAALMVMTQLTFDRFMPMVSSFLHIAGAGCGAVLAWPCSLRYFALRERRARA
jgi:rhomboid protease GluP